MSPSLSRRQRGATLIEVLIAALVLSVGVLSLLQAQVKALAVTRMSEQQQVASLAAEELAELILSNPGGAAGYTWTQAYLSNASAAAAKAPCNFAAGCTAAEVAAADLGGWISRVRSQLPDGDAYVVPRATGGVDIWVMWRASASVGGGVDSSPVCPKAALNALDLDEYPYCHHLGVGQ